MNELERQLLNEWLLKAPTVKVYLKRLVVKNYNEQVGLPVVYYKNKIYLYDAYTNKWLSMKRYKKDWALTLGDLK